MKFNALILAVALSLGGLAPAVQAQSIASKVEYQGVTQHVIVAGLAARERNGFLHLQIELDNADNYPRRIFWRVKWLDEDGFQVWDDEPWKPVLVQRYARQNLQAMAPTPKARDFLIQFSAEDGGSNRHLSNPDPLYR